MDSDADRVVFLKPHFCSDACIVVVLGDCQIVHPVPDGIILMELVADIEPRLEIAKVPVGEKGSKIRAQDFRRQGRARFAHCKYPGGCPGRRC